MPAGITIIGLGTGRRNSLTMSAYQLLNDAEEIYLRTTHHPGVSNISAATFFVDDLFVRHDYEQANETIAAEIARLGQRQRGVIYAVPGHPTFDDPTVPLIRSPGMSARCCS